MTVALRPLMWGAAASVLAYVPMILIHGYCITGNGGWVIAGVEFFMVVPAIAILIAGSCLLFLPFSRTRRSAVQWLLASATVAVMLVPSMRAAWDLRSHGFHLAAQRARPLIEAIESHIRDHGTPPSTLQDLIPRYLASIPEGLPPLVIVTGEAAREHFYAYVHE